MQNATSEIPAREETVGRMLRQQFGLLAPDEFAALRGVDTRTLDVERCHGRGPDYVKLGRRVFYRTEDVMTWIRLNVTQTDRAA